MKKFKTLSQVAYALECSLEEDGAISDMCVDSRLVQPHNLFFAFEGERADGHLFLEQVAKNGAAGAVVREDYSGPDYGLPLLRVANPLHALQLLAKQAVASFSGLVVGITGSLGKTTTKEFLYTILAERFNVTRTPGNHNSQIGLPLTVLNHVQGDEDVIILEMAMSEFGQLAGLVEIAPPDIAIITTIALVHAYNFDSIDAIALSKAQIFSAKKTRLGLVPKQCDQYELLCKQGSCPKKAFSAEFVAPDFPFPANHHRHNFAAARACAEALGMTFEEIERAVPKLKLTERRFEFVERNGILFVNDSYNAALPSVRAALEGLPEPKSGGKRIAVLGEMPQLGKFSKDCHSQVAEISLKCVDQMFCLGGECGPIVDLWKQHQRPVEWFEERSELVKSLKNQIKPGDVVLLKGANKKELWKVLEEI